LIRWVKTNEKVNFIILLLKEAMQKYPFPFLLLLASIVFGACQQPHSSEDKDSSTYYKEAHRPQFHFSPPSQWMNDPNGMVYWKGDYHLFYQYYPDSNVWGPMHWGHAKSSDLVTWEHQPIALYPDSLGYIFSGSAVADLNNSSGFGKEGQVPLVAIFSYHHPEREAQGRSDYQSQGLAYSLDDGKTWVKYHKNPVLESPGIKDFRDPKVFWHEPSQSWIMSLAVLDKIGFYGSHNLIDWDFLSFFSVDWANFDGVWECPDLFSLRAPDGKEHWVLLVSINPGGPLGGSATQYFIGDFDGKEFKVQSNRVLWLDYGPDNYAGVTWSNVSPEEGRTLFIGWMSNWEYAQQVPTTQWRSAMTLPRSLGLVGREPSLRLANFPVREVFGLMESPFSITEKECKLSSDLLHLSLVPEQEIFSLEWSNVKGNVLKIESNGTHFFVDRSQSGIVDFNANFSSLIGMDLEGRVVEKLDIFLDKSSLEIFINDGERSLTTLVFPELPYAQLALQGFRLPAQGHYFRSIWQ
jgi:fructan beta-fructosidase